MICWTRSNVSGATSGRLLRTRETVCVDTPAARATSLIVRRRPAVMSPASPWMAVSQIVADRVLTGDRRRCQFLIVPVTANGNDNRGPGGRQPRVWSQDPAVRGKHDD